jgi:hypothetical protein
MKYFLFASLLIVTFTSCAPVWQKHLKSYNNNSSDSISIQPDYSSLNFWAAHPLKHDTSDSVPAFLVKGYTTDTTADVFFIHPTTYTDKLMPFGWNAPILQSDINSKTDNSSILYQASIFNITDHVYAPRYRQANYHSYFTEDTAHALEAFRFAYADIKKAFVYYLNHENRGRPIIIATHSQGTTQAKLLLREFFDGKPLQNQLVAAYLVGIAVEPDWFKNISVCTTPDQTGCLCSWRTYEKGYLPDFIKKETFTAVVTNPLTWKGSEPIADRSKNLGGVLLQFNKRVPYVSDAEIHRGVLWINKPHFIGSIFYRNKNYHVADYNLFYMNIQQNIKQRLKAWREKG